MFSILSVTKNGRSEIPTGIMFFFSFSEQLPTESPRVEQAYSWIIFKISSKHFFFSQVSLEAVEKMMHELVDDGEVWCIMKWFVGLLVALIVFLVGCHSISEFCVSGFIIGFNGFAC